VKVWTLIRVVLGVSAASALFGWIMFRFSKSMERAERDPKYKRRIFLRSAAVYGCGIVLGVVQVLSGDAPPWALLGLAIPILFVWWFLRLAKQARTPRN